MSRLRSLKTEALVIGTMRLQEADRLLTLYTRERGRVSAVAKGARRARSKMGGRLEPFSLVHVVLHEGRSLYTITGVETIRTFQGVRESLFRLEEGARLLEAIRRLFPEEEGNPSAFNLLVRAVGRLAVAHDRHQAFQLVLATRLKLLLTLGYLPELESCIECGGQESICGFHAARGGVLCRECYTSDRDDCFALSAEGVWALRELLARPLVEAAEVEMGELAALEIERAIVRTLGYHGH